MTDVAEANAPPTPAPETLAGSGVGRDEMVRYGITEAVLDQWEQSATVDRDRREPWMANPAAMLACIPALRATLAATPATQTERWYATGGNDRTPPTPALTAARLVERYVESVPAEDFIVMQRVGGRWEVYHARYSDSPRQSSRGASLSDAILAALATSPAPAAEVEG